MMLVADKLTLEMERNLMIYGDQGEVNNDDRLSMKKLFICRKN